MHPFRSLRYALRPPLSLERLARAAEGRVVLGLRRPLHDGTTAVAFTPMELSKRLAASFLEPKRQSVRYFGRLRGGRRHSREGDSQAG